MGKTTLPIKQNQIEKAVVALQTYEKNQQTQQASAGLPSDLLEEQQYIYLVISTKRVPEKGSLKPHRMYVFECKIGMGK